MNASATASDEQIAGEGTHPEVNAGLSSPSAEFKPDLQPQEFSRLTQPNNPGSVRSMIAFEFDGAYYRAERHDVLAARWESAASWTRVIVTLTSGISALSILSDSIALATTFAIITAAVAAVNAGFNPPERARNHRDSARRYSHLLRPLQELLFKMDEYYDFDVGPTAYNSETGKYYAAPPKPLGTHEKQELRSIWDGFSELRRRIETILDTEPSLTKLWQKKCREQDERRPNAEGIAI